MPCKLSLAVLETPGDLKKILKEIEKVGVKLLEECAGEMWWCGSISFRGGLRGTGNRIRYLPFDPKRSLTPADRLKFLSQCFARSPAESEMRNAQGPRFGLRMFENRSHFPNTDTRLVLVLLRRCVPASWRWTATCLRRAQGKDFNP